MAKNLRQRYFFKVRPGKERTYWRQCGANATFFIAQPGEWRYLRQFGGLIVPEYFAMEIILAKIKVTQEQRRA